MPLMQNKTKSNESKCTIYIQKVLKNTITNEKQRVRKNKEGFGVRNTELRNFVEERLLSILKSSKGVGRGEAWCPPPLSS